MEITVDVGIAKLEILWGEERQGGGMNDAEWSGVEWMFLLKPIFCSSWCYPSSGVKVKKAPRLVLVDG